MQNPSQLVDDLVAAIRAMPGVVALLEGNSSNVVAYKPTYPTVNSLALAIQQMNPPSILVSHAGTTFGRNTEHRFSVVLKPRGSADGLFVALRDGVPTGYGGQKFKRIQVNQSCGLPLFQQYGPRTMFVSETSAIDFHEAVLTLSERGTDD